MRLRRRAHIVQLRTTCLLQVPQKPNLRPEIPAQPHEQLKNRISPSKPLHLRSVDPRHAIQTHPRLITRHPHRRSPHLHRKHSHLQRQRNHGRVGSSLKNKWRSRQVQTNETQHDHQGNYWQLRGCCGKGRGVGVLSQWDQGTQEWERYCGKDL